LTATVVVLGLPVVLAAAGRLLAGESPTTQAANPHWRPDGCPSCHQISQGKAVAISPRQADLICLDCHDGKRARAESHPIGCALEGDRFVRPKDWPLVDGRLGCLTCHDVRRICNRSVRRSLANPAFLRGRKVNDPRTFCANCHRRTLYKKFNPHLMLTADKLAREDLCRFCHTKMLDRTAMQRVGTPALRTNPLSLCASCHARHVDYFQPGHIGAKVPKDMVAYMAARESTGPTSRPSRDLLARLRSSGAKPRFLVLDGDGRIVCTTCHNPHERGLFRPGSELAHRAMSMVSPDRVSSPVRSQRLCLSCHNL